MSFNFNQDLVLEDERVLLRALQNSDVEHLLKFLSMNRNLGTLVKGNGKKLDQLYSISYSGRENKTQFPFIVFDKKLGKYAGSTRFDINLEFKTLLLGFTWYGKQFRGTGLNKHCKYLLLQFALKLLDGACRISLTIRIREV
jgi:RimJ/RimL family protein N-acetyltransferase